MKVMLRMRQVMIAVANDGNRVVQDGEAMRKAMVDKVPSKIDIGPVYNVNPQHRTAYSGQPFCHVFSCFPGTVGLLSPTDALCIRLPEDSTSTHTTLMHAEREELSTCLYLIFLVVWGGWVKHLGPQKEFPAM